MENKKSLSFPRLVIAAPASGSGKTTFAMGLMGALCRKGYSVQPYKVGPDYIDPAFHTVITGRNSINLDSWMLDDSYIKQMFISYSQEVQFSIIEGVMGLYDGNGDDPFSCSTAGIARMLKAPVILVMPAAGMAASAAALVYGLKEFGGINIVGVVINKPSSANQYKIVKSAIEKHTGVKVAGFLPATEGIELKSRHLGLVQSSEVGNIQEIIHRLADLVEKNTDVEFFLKAARLSEELDSSGLTERDGISAEKVNIAVAWDKAFSFYYHENLEVLHRLGAKVKFFSPLKDSSLPANCGGIYIGGGYPEIFAEEIAANESLKKEIRRKAETGMPIYAECGGYMYLNRKYTAPNGECYDFAGIFDGDVEMTGRLQNFGYVELTGQMDTMMFHKGDRIRAHEFHRSVVHRGDRDCCVKINKVRNGKETEWYCGRAYNKVFGMYPHIYFPSNIKWAQNFVKNCLSYM